jgi:hypothetical protein
LGLPLAGKACLNDIQGFRNRSTGFLEVLAFAIRLNDRDVVMTWDGRLGCYELYSVVWRIECQFLGLLLTWAALLGELRGTGVFSRAFSLGYTGCIQDYLF